MPEITDEQLELIIDNLMETQDEGPPGEGWHSDELLALIEELEAIQMIAAGDALIHRLSKK